MPSSPRQAGLLDDAEVEIAAFVPVGHGAATRCATKSRTAAWMSRSSSLSRWSTFQQVQQGSTALHQRSIPATAGALLDLVLAQQHLLRSSSQRYKEFRLGPAPAAPEASLHQAADDTFTDPGVMPSLVDHENPAGPLGLGGDVVGSAANKPAQIADPR